MLLSTDFLQFGPSKPEATPTEIIWITPIFSRSGRLLSAASCRPIAAKPCRSKSRGRALAAFPGVAAKRSAEQN
jgi:hypothetical protein